MAQIYCAGQLLVVFSQAVTDLNKPCYCYGERHLPTSTESSPDTVNCNCRLAVYDTDIFTA